MKALHWDLGTEFSLKKQSLLDNDAVICKILNRIDILNGGFLKADDATIHVQITGHP